MSDTIYRGGNAINLLGEYYDSILVKRWLENHDYPSLKRIADIFYKAARDFKAGKIDINDFSGICDILYFDTYLNISKHDGENDLDERIKTALSIFSDSYKEEADENWLLKKEFHEKYLGFVKAEDESKKVGKNTTAPS